MARRNLVTGGIALWGAGAAAQTAPKQGENAGANVFNLRQLGAIADGKTLNTAIFAKAFALCASAHGGTVHVPAGEYLTGPILLGSNTALDLAPGAVIKGSPNFSDYQTEPGALSSEIERAGLVTARHADNVAITGFGVIDGNGLAFHKQMLRPFRDWDPRYTRQKEGFMAPDFGTETGPLDHGERPGNLIRFIDCRGVLLDGVTIQNSPTWTIHVNRCRDVRVRGLNVNSDASNRRIPNDDGMDFSDSTDIRISDCRIRTGDDCISVFGSRNMVVTNCNLASRSSGIRVGYDAGETRNCLFQNITVDSNCGLKVNVRGSGSVEDVLFSNITIRAVLTSGKWWGRGEPIHVSSVRLRKEVPLNRLRRIWFENIMAQSESGILLYGSPDGPLEDVSMENVQLHISLSKLQSGYGGNFDLRGVADLTQAVFQHDISAIYFRHMRGLRLNKIRVSWDDGMPECFTHLMEGEEFQDLAVASLEGRQAQAGQGTVLALRNGSGVAIRDCVAAPGAGVFLALDHVADQRLFVNNDLGRARTVFEPANSAFTQSGNLLPR